MDLRTEIREELEMLGSVLAKLPNTVPYLVPGHYFSSTSTVIMGILHTENQPDITVDFGRDLPFSVPSDYFDSLPGSILKKVTAAEPANTALDHLSKVNSYQVPGAYFESLPDAILHKVKETKKAVPVPVKKIQLYRTARLAAAIALIIFTGLGMMQYTKSVNRETISFAGISRNVIDDYIQQDIDDFDLEMIESTIANTTTDISGIDINSNNDIVEYLDETGWN